MDNWSTKKVLKQLRDNADPGTPVSVQIFLNESIPSAELKTHVSRIVADAQESVHTGAPAKIGKVHGIAKSFGLKASPEIIEAIALSPSVKNILPSEIDNIYPKPMTSKPR